MKLNIVLPALASLIIATTAQAGLSRTELLALLQNPNSDWSSLFAHVNKAADKVTEAELAAGETESHKENEMFLTLAQLDAQLYVKTYTGERDYSHFSDVGTAHALKHGLQGILVYEYCIEFSKVMMSLTTKE